MRSVLQVVAAGEGDYYDTTLPRLSALARRLKCDLHVISSGAASEAYDVRENAWMKLSSLPLLYTQYDRILLLDADILPNFELLRRSDFDPLFESGLCLAQDHGSDLITERFADWSRRRMPHGIPIEVGRPYYNSGVIGLSAQAASYIHYVWERWRPIPVEVFNDQDFLNWLIYAHGLTVTRLDQSMNWMEPQLRCESLERGKLIHFAGSDRKPLIPWYATALQPVPQCF